MARKAKDNGKGGVGMAAPKDRMKATAEPIPAQFKEQTKGQVGRGGMSILFSAPGLGESQPGTFAVYRKMKSQPTIAMARVAATAPVKKAEVTVETMPKADPRWKTFIEETLIPQWSWIRNQSLFALDYGNQPFEKVFDVKDGLIVLKKLKPLLVDATKILVDKEDGSFAGLKQGRIVLPPEKSFCYVNDSEAGSFFGRSRHENCRFEWSQWIDTAIRMGDYGRKVAGVIPIILYPEGESDNEQGSTTSNFELAEQMLRNLGSKMKGIAMPNQFAKYSDDLIRNGVDLDQLRPWIISFLETKGQHGGDFVKQLSYWDKNLVRGWLMPERAVQEGEHGTKAEAAAHIDVALAVAEELLEDLVRCVNWYIVDQLLVINFGEVARGQVFLEHGPLIDSDKLFVRAIFEKVLAQPSNFGMLFDILDIDSIIDQSGLPRKESIDESLVLPDPTPLLDRPRPTLPAPVVE